MRSEYVSGIRCFTYALTDLAETFTDSSPLIRKSDLSEMGLDGWEELAEWLDPTVIQNLTFQRLYAPGDFDFDSDISDYADSYEETAQLTFGDAAQEVAAYGVLCQSGEQKYLFALRFLKFSKGWKLWAIDTNLLQVSPSRPVIPVTDEQLSSALKDGV